MYQDAFIKESFIEALVLMLHETVSLIRRISNDLKCYLQNFRVFISFLCEIICFSFAVCRFVSWTG